MALFRKSKAQSKVRQLAKAGDAAGLIAMITGPDPAKDRADAAHELPRLADEIEARHGDAAHSALTSATHDPNPEVRSSALFALAELRWDDTVDHLMAAADDSEWIVRVFAVTLLGRFPEERVVLRLGAVLADDPEGMVREAAASSLGELGDRRGVEPLRRAASEDREREVRRAAQGAVRRLEDDSG